jgi:DNA polymerase-3 subunit epsilon
MRYSWLQARRWFLSHSRVEEPLHSMMASGIPARSATFAETEFVALDIETTSLDAATADMLSVGWVVLRGGRVALKTARSWLVQPSGDVGKSASVHGLTDTVVGEGLNWGVVLDKIVNSLRGRVLLVHHAGLDKALLDRMCLQRYGAKLLVPVVDTLELELRRQRRAHHVEENQSLRLGDLRDAYNLPRYGAHDALSDAIATAELLIAIVRNRKSTRLDDLLA